MLYLLGLRAGIVHVIIQVNVGLFLSTLRILSVSTTVNELYKQTQYPDAPPKNCCSIHQIALYLLGLCAGIAHVINQVNVGSKL